MFPLPAYPCSPKSVYRLADKLALEPLEELALYELKTNLGLAAAVREVVSPFSKVIEPVRKVQLDQVLKHWVGVYRASYTYLTPCRTSSKGTKNWSRSC
jgi:hypothetical protein